MKCHDNIRWSTEVCIILTKKSRSPFSFSSFSFPLFPSFSFCSSPPHFHFFPGNISPPPGHSILHNIYPWKNDLKKCIFADNRAPITKNVDLVWTPMTCGANFFSIYSAQRFERPWPQIYLPRVLRFRGAKTKLNWIIIVWILIISWYF